MADSTRKTDRTSSKEYSAPSGLPGDALGAYTVKNAQLQNMLSAVTGKEASAAAAAGQAAEKAGAASGEALVAEGEATAATRDNAAKIADAFHTRTDDPDNLILAARTKIESLKISKDALRQRIDTEAQINPWDDPLRWAINKFTLPSLIDAHNAVNAQQNSETQYIDKLQNQVLTQQNIDLPAVGAQIRQAAAAKSTAEIQRGIEASQRLLSQSKGIEANGIMQQMQGNKSLLEANIQVLRMQAEQRMESKTDAELAALAIPLQNYNTKMAAMGQKGYSPEEFKYLSAAKKSDIIEYGRNGATFGNSPGDSILQLINRGGATSISSVNPQIPRFIASQRNSADYAAAAGELSKNTKFVQASPEDQMAAIFDKMSLDQKNKAGQAGSGGQILGNNTLPEANPYKLKLVGAALAPGLETNVFASAITAESARRPLAPINESFLTSTLLAKAAADPGNIDKLVSDFSAFFAKGTDYQHRTSGAAQMGYPTFDGYMLSDIRDNRTGKAIQALSPAEVKYFVINSQAQKYASPLNDNFPPSLAGP